LLSYNGTGGDIIVFTGKAELSEVDPADRLPTYLEKYRDFIARRYATPENFASIYSVALLLRGIRPIAVRGH